MLPPTDTPDFGQTWPRTIIEAVDQLTHILSQAQKDQIAGMAEEDLSLLHFGLGQRIRNAFGLWGENRELLLDCQQAKLGEMRNIPKDFLAELPKEWFDSVPEVRSQLLFIHPDTASTLIVRALWARLRH